MGGLVGRSSFLLSCRVGQYSRRLLFYVNLALFVLGVLLWTSSSQGIQWGRQQLWHPLLGVVL